jgi:hypothetical protein
MTTMITTHLPSTGYVAPTRAQLKSLRALVGKTYPWIDGVAVDSEEAEREFLHAFWAQGQFYRTELPAEDRYFVALLDDANALLTERGYSSVGGGAFLAAALAAGDVVWRKHDPSVGQLLAVGLNAYRGHKCDSRWLAVLSGTGNLLGPMAARAEFVHRALKGVPQATFWTHGENGLRLVRPEESLWSGS